MRLSTPIHIEPAPDIDPGLEIKVQRWMEAKAQHVAQGKRVKRLEEEVLCDPQAKPLVEKGGQNSLVTSGHPVAVCSYTRSIITTPAHRFEPFLAKQSIALQMAVTQGKYTLNKSVYNKLPEVEKRKLAKHLEFTKAAAYLTMLRGAGHA